MFRVPTETRVITRRRTSTGISLDLSRPNITVELKSDDDARDPAKVAHAVRLQTGGRQVLSGLSFTGETKGACRKRWEELLSAAPVEKKVRKTTRKKREREVRIE